MRTAAFIDGQNLYHLARNAWSRNPSDQYGWPSYDVEKLSTALVQQAFGCGLSQIHFYTGVPPTGPWHRFWSNKIRVLKNKGIYVYRGRVRQQPGGQGQEKGVDVSLSIDLVRTTYDREYDAILIVSQDWDYGPAVRLAKKIARTQGRQLAFASAFPYHPGMPQRGVPGTTWIHIDKALYDRCHDPTDYRL